MTKYLSVIYVFLLCGLLYGAGENWLSGVDDAVYLSELSIPGTHNSGAVYAEPWPGTAICQDLTIAQQLAAGVRYLDIRCRRYDDQFRIHHGQVYQNISFDDVLVDCTSFLTANPTETIIMSVMEGYDAYNSSLSFEQVFDNYVAQNPGLWNLRTTIPKMGEVRGQIMLLRRFGASTPKGLKATNWQNNTTFSISGSAPMRIQDYYNCDDGAAKWTAVSSLLNEAQSGSQSILYINYTSGYKSGLFGIPSIPTISDYVNPRLETYCTENPLGRVGVMAMDFATEDLCEKIYRTNFDDSSYNLNHFAELASAWLTTTGGMTFNARYDLDDSGGIEMADFQLFLNNWLR